MKNVLVIGSGGREHAIASKLAESKEVATVFFAPGNAATFDKCVRVPIPVSDFESLKAFAIDNEVYFTVVGPEAPLASGIVDYFRLHSLPIFGPTKEAANLEASKVFSKEIMIEAGVSTASSKTFTSSKEAEEYILSGSVPVVIKADGLAAGKGVCVALDYESALSAVRECLEDNRFGSAGSQVLIEEFLPGREASVMAVISNGSICMLPVSSDYKRAYDNNEGPNTGGMGAITPTPVFPESRLEEVKAKVFIPVVETLKKRGIDYSGFLYAGLMILPDESIKVIEFNCRLGDPETQALLERIDEDFFLLLEKAVFRPAELPPCVKLSDSTTIIVVLASKGYPLDPESGQEIHGLMNTDTGDKTIKVFHAGTKQQDEKVLTAGGRVLAVVVSGDSVAEVRDKAYKRISQISFSGMQYRKDIGVISS